VNRMLLVLAGGLALLYAGLFRIVARASTRLRRQADENRHQARHDELTGLPNRAHFYEQVKEAIATPHAKRSIAAVMIIDLDRFKEINDTLGHHHGDLVLKQAATRLKSILRERDVLARLGGDEFGLLVTDVRDRGGVGEVSTRIQAALARPFAVGELCVDVEASVGVSLHPDHGSDVNVLLQRADVAMYEAKRSQSGIETYSAERDPYTPERLALVSELREALVDGDLVMHYQPKVDVASGQVVGVEALVRWQHAERGLLPPSEFVPLAERTGVAAALTRYVLGKALEQCRAWRDQAIELDVAVNLAAPDVVDASLPGTVRELLERSQVPARRLQLEVTEGTAMTDPVRASRVLSALRMMGVRISLDDFGTGNTSMAYLKSLPVQEVKIDRSFVTGMMRDSSDAAIVRSTIDLGRNLGMTVVAEGVETADTLRELGALDCDTAQGFHLGRPAPAAELTPRLLERVAAVNGSGRFEAVADPF
jgi:diguanylate cyclase (GGDEF)-like protein